MNVYLSPQSQLMVQELLLDQLFQPALLATHIFALQCDSNSKLCTADNAQAYEQEIFIEYASKS